VSLDFSNLDFVDAGWHDSPEYRFEAERDFSYLNFNQVFGASFEEKPRKLNLTAYLEKCHGKDWELHQGSCGSCVAHGYAIAVDILEAIDHVENGAELPARTAPEPIYWSSRVDIGGNRLGGAGSVGAWAAEAVKRFGVVPHGQYGSDDLTRYDAARCCSRKSHQPLADDLKQVARKHTVKDYAKIRSWDDMIDALAAGYPVPVCSNQGFSQNRDSNSISEARGSWGHCMCIAGYDLDLDCALIVNSWGKFFHGGNLNQGSFFARRSVVERMLRQDDTFSVSNLEGWPRKKLSFAALNF
jgi:hypothetical protein